MDDPGTNVNPPAIEEYNCSECAIKVFAVDRKCPKCGTTMWKVSQLRNMGKFFSLFFGILGIPAIVLMLGISIVGFVFSLKEGGTEFWLGCLFFFGVLSLMIIRVIALFRKMAREGVFDKKLQAKAARIVPPV